MQLGQHLTRHRATGDHDRGRRRFNDAFWNSKEEFFALALDGRKDLVRSVTSPEHADAHDPPPLQRRNLKARPIMPFRGLPRLSIRGVDRRPTSHST